MKAEEIKAKIEKIKTMPGLTDKTRAEMLAAWEKKLGSVEKPVTPAKEETEEPEDLFEHPDKVPVKVQNILEKLDGSLNYERTQKLKKQVEALGYTFDSGMDNEPYNLRKISKEKPETKSIIGKIVRKAGSENFKDFYEIIESGTGYFEIKNNFSELNVPNNFNDQKTYEALSKDQLSEYKDEISKSISTKKPAAKRGPVPKPKPLNIDITKPVKFKKPDGKDEAKLIFKVTNYNEETGRVYITPINDKDGIGEELVDAKDLKNVKPKKERIHAPKTKSYTYKFKGKEIQKLDDKDCDDLIKETRERRQKAAKAEKKSKSRPIIEKVTTPIVKSVKKAIDNISAADLKDEPGKELSRVDKAIAATKKFLMELKTILGEDFDKDTVDDEMKELHALSKELHKKYGE